VITACDHDDVRIFPSFAGLRRRFVYTSGAIIPHKRVGDIDIYGAREDHAERQRFLVDRAAMSNTTHVPFAMIKRKTERVAPGAGVKIYDQASHWGKVRV
jgi:hypothetical protein